MTEGATPKPTRTRGFPFDRPLNYDGMFWYAIVVLALTTISVLNAGTTFFGGVFIDVPLAWLINFVVFVLPVAGIRAAVRRSRAKNAATGPDHPADTST